MNVLYFRGPLGMAHIHALTCCWLETTSNCEGLKEMEGIEEGMEGEMEGLNNSPFSVFHIIFFRYVLGNQLC